MALEGAPWMACIKLPPKKNTLTMPRKRAARMVREMAMDRYGFLSDLQPRRQYPYSPHSSPEEGGRGRGSVP